MENWDVGDGWMDGWMDALCYVMCIATCCLPCKYVLYSTCSAGGQVRIGLCTVHWAIISNQQ